MIPFLSLPLLLLPYFHTFNVQNNIKVKTKHEKFHCNVLEGEFDSTKLLKSLEYFLDTVPYWNGSHWHHIRDRWLDDMAMMICMLHSNAARGVHFLEDGENHQQQVSRIRIWLQFPCECVKNNLYSPCKKMYTISNKDHSRDIKWECFIVCRRIKKMPS